MNKKGDVLELVKLIGGLVFGALIALGLVFITLGIYNLFFETPPEQEGELCWNVKDAVKEINDNTELYSITDKDISSGFVYAKLLNALINCFDKKIDKEQKLCAVFDFKKDPNIEKDPEKFKEIVEKYDLGKKDKYLPALFKVYNPSYFADYIKPNVQPFKGLVCLYSSNRFNKNEIYFQNCEFSIESDLDDFEICEFNKKETVEILHKNWIINTNCLEPAYFLPEFDYLYGYTGSSIIKKDSGEKIALEFIDLIKKCYNLKNPTFSRRILESELLKHQYVCEIVDMSNLPENVLLVKEISPGVKQRIEEEEGIKVVNLFDIIADPKIDFFKPIDDKPVDDEEWWSKNLNIIAGYNTDILISPGKHLFVPGIKKGLTNKNTYCINGFIDKDGTRKIYIKNCPLSELAIKLKEVPVCT